jgi:hypothetical protein
MAVHLKGTRFPRSRGSAGAQSPEQKIRHPVIGFRTAVALRLWEIGWRTSARRPLATDLVTHIPDMIAAAEGGGADECWGWCRYGGEPQRVFAGLVYLGVGKWFVSGSTQTNTQPGPTLSTTIALM